MPTAGRPTFARAAVEMFERQTYPHRELVIVDDERSPSFPLSPAGDKIRYERTRLRLDIGSKRNLCCSRTRGEIIVTWDDDDTYSDVRIERQVEALLESDAFVVGCQSLEFCHIETGERWLYEGHEPMDCPGGTLAYRKDYWRVNPFKPAQSGEERAFLAPAWAAKRLHVMEPGDIIVATIHRGNTSPRETFRKPWRKVA